MVKKIDPVFKNPNSVVRIGTLFSGIGSAERALQRLNLNHEIVFACDIDKYVRQSYFANYQIKEENWFDDIKSFVFHEHAKKYKGKIDLLVGGSPCQSFSIVGKRGGLNDTRGTLFYYFAKVIEQCQPKVFIFENVKGLISHDSGKTWATIHQVFSDLGYKIFPDVADPKSAILNAKDYGIPQNRERIFVVGFKNKKTKFNYPPPKDLCRTMQDFLEDDVDSKYTLKQKGVKFVTSEKNIKKRYTQINLDKKTLIGDKKKFKINTKLIKPYVTLCQKRNQQSNWHGDFVFQRVEGKLKSDEFIFPIKQVEKKYFLSQKVKEYVLSTGTKNFSVQPKTDLKVARPLLQTLYKMHRAGVDNYVTYTHGRIRKLTPVECLRLMGFRSFKIVVSDMQAYRQAGNSIVVDVLMELYKAIDITKFAKKLTK